MYALVIDFIMCRFNNAKFRHVFKALNKIKNNNTVLKWTYGILKSVVYLLLLPYLIIRKVCIVLYTRSVIFYKIFNFFNKIYRENWRLVYLIGLKNHKD